MTAANLIEAAGEAGITAERCLAGTRLAPDDLTGTDRVVSAAQEIQIVRNVIAATGHGTELACSAGARYQLPSAGFLGFAVLASNTLGEAIALGIRYRRLAPVFASVSLRVDEQTAAALLDDRDPPADVRPFLIERDAATFVGVTSTLFGGSVPGGFRVSLQRAPDGDRALEELVDVEYRAECDAITFPAQLLDRPLTGANSVVAAHCIAQCDELIAERHDGPPFATRVHRRLARDPAAMPLMRALASELGTTERTLRRRLAREGTGYRSLLDEIRGSVAADLLTGGATVKQTAQQLGYSEPAAFHHAFTRWHDAPPARFRRGG